MAQKSYPFSSSIISSRELALLSKDNILSAAASDTVEAALMLLQEKGYAKGAPELSNAYAFESVVAYELKEAVGFLKSVAPDENLLSLFLLRYDYLNLKTLLKLNLLGAEFSENNMSPFGAIPFEVLKESIADKSYFRLPQQMAEAMRDLDKQFAIHEDPTMIGIKLDRAYSKQVTAALEGEKNPLVMEYFKAYFDFTNIMVVLRLKNAGYTADILKDVLLEGGRFNAFDMQKAFEDKADSAVSEFYHYGYEAYLKEPFEKMANGGGLAAVEKARDDYLLMLLKKDRFNMFTSSRAVAYLIAKEREAAAVRLLMVSMLNHIGPEEMSTRLKALYV